MSANPKTRLESIRAILPDSFQDAICHECTEKGSHGSSPCGFSMKDLPHRLIIDGDRLPKAEGEQSCDCIIFLFNEILYICIVELKSTRIKPSSILKKFVDTINKIQAECVRLRQATFEPVFILLSKSINTIDLEQIVNYRFKLFHESRSLRIRKCGFELKRIFLNDSNV
jgi:hypothetical protein